MYFRLKTLKIPPPNVISPIFFCNFFRCGIHSWFYWLLERSQIPSCPRELQTCTRLMQAGWNQPGAIDRVASARCPPQTKNPGYAGVYSDVLIKLIIYSHTMHRAYLEVMSQCLVSNGDVPLCEWDHAGATTETRRRNTAAQAVVHHGRSANSVDECGVSYWNPERFDQFWTQMIKKAEAIDVDWYLEEKTALAIWWWAVRVQVLTARTSIIRHSLMPMIPSESSICHTNLGTTMFHTLE